LNPKVLDKPEAGNKADLPISVASDATFVDPSLGKCQVNQSHKRHKMPSE
jgi:hypothetical protein